MVFMPITLGSGLLSMPCVRFPTVAVCVDLGVEKRGMEGFGSCLETLLRGCKGMGLDKTGEEERAAEA